MFLQALVKPVARPTPPLAASMTNANIDASSGFARFFSELLSTRNYID